MTEITMEKMKKALECFDDIVTNYQLGDWLEFEMDADKIECFKTGADVLREKVQKTCPTCESEYFDGLCDCEYHKHDENEYDEEGNVI